MDPSLIFWTLVSASGILFAIGIRNKSWKVFIWSGITMFLPAIYFFGAENWFILLGFMPWIPFGIAYTIVKIRAAQ